MNLLENAKEMKKILRKIVSEIVREETRSCFRVYKATVVTAPYTDPTLGSVCGVRMNGDTTTLIIPYSSKVQSMGVGDSVYVATTFNSLRNAIVWEFQNFK